MTGGYPFAFDGEPLLLVLAAIENCVYEIPDGLGLHLSDLLSKILEKDLAVRLTVEQIKSHPWCACKPLQEEGALAVEFPARDESSEAERGTTLVPFLQVRG